LPTVPNLPTTGPGDCGGARSPAAAGSSVT
jgi:hypothetical protein